jgi:PBP1b-binding outer membrane lipoprotein LpoB|tara:strand:+ start:414 stop:638 length:225 start_codon:yes stop_codon:yes gene_type:complete
MIKKLILTVLLLSIFLVGCQQVQKQPEEIAPTEPVTEEAEISIDSEISEIDALDADLDLEELDNIEAELDEINW